MGDLILSINAGSSSLKFSAYAVGDAGETLAFRYHGSITDIGADAGFRVVDAAGIETVDRALGRHTTQASALDEMIDWFATGLADESILAVGHRVVHGADSYPEPVVVDRPVLDRLRQLIPLASSHQPHNLAAIDAIAAIRPGLTQVACFDTSFHQSQPVVARQFAIPRELSSSGVKRYGFHGLSYEHIASVLPEIAGQWANGKVVVAHLGHGASMCAMRNRKSVATTMGFTVLEGLAMGRRCGDLDPGVIPHLVRDRDMTLDEVEDMLYHRSGLLGVSGISDDMHRLLTSDRPEAAEAVELFCYRVTRELGSLAAALGGLDALVFTGGIGENAPRIRSSICADAGWLGVRIDEDANLAGERSLHREGTTPAVYVVPTDEELMIARHTCRLVITEANPPAP